MSAMVRLGGSLALVLLLVLQPAAGLPAARAWTGAAGPAPARSAPFGEGEQEQPAGRQGDKPAEASSLGLEQGLGQLPLYFVENQGQVDPQVAYYVQGSDKTIYFTPQGLTVALTSPSDVAPRGSGPAPSRWQDQAPPRQRYALKLDFVGANAHARPEGLERAEATISYFKGRPEAWRTGLATYAKVIYRELWPGIDLIYYGGAGAASSGAVHRLKYEFLVRPGADPGRIRLRYRGADAVSVDEAGQLQVSTPLGGFSDEAPLAYQEGEAGQRHKVMVAYAGPEEQGGAYSYGFRLGQYDESKALVLDPAVLLYCGYIGGIASDTGDGIAVDAEGNAYVTGYTYSGALTFPVAVGPDLDYHGEKDAYVAKVKPGGEGLVYCGYIGGKADEVAFAIAVDEAGSAYVAGQTFSDEDTFPVWAGPDLTYNGAQDGFVAKVSPDGKSLDYSGYIGGDDWDTAQDIAVDWEGSAYVTGATNSKGTFPVIVGPDLDYNDYGDAFVAKVEPRGAALLYCGYIGGDASDLGYGIAVDWQGNAYVTGETYSSEVTFPVTVGPSLIYMASDAFVAKVDPWGASLLYCGYIGGRGGETAFGIAVDGDGSAYVTGLTYSREDTFPLVGGPDLTYNGGSDAFVAKVDPRGASLVYCGYIGGAGDDGGNGIAVDQAGNAYIMGYAASGEATFPVKVGPDLSHNGGGSDAFVAKVGATGSALSYCGYIGGVAFDTGADVVVDDDGNAYVTGYTESDEATFPEVVGPDLSHNGAYDAFVALVGKPDLIKIEIPLRRGWNLFSFDLELAQGTAPITRVAEVLGSIDGLYTAVLGYDQGAESYYPELPPEFNDLQEMDPYHGYWIKMSEAATLYLQGWPLPNDDPLRLDAGWNLVSYLPDQQIGVKDALASIADKYTAVLGFHDGGAVSYYPELPPEFNDLQCLRPQHGYWIKTTEAATLTYPTTGICAAP